MANETETTTMFKKAYKMRSLGEDGLNTVVSIPRIVIQREADRRSITIAEFLKNYKAVAHFDNIDGIHYTFEKVNKDKNDTDH